jgi:hypothetical protein
VLGICVERTPHEGYEQDAILVSRFLDYPMSYRGVFSHRHAGGATDQLIAATSNRRKAGPRRRRWRATAGVPRCTTA